MKRIVLTIAASVLALSFMPVLAGIANASCAGPEVEVNPITVTPGGTATVIGRSFLATCYDTSSNDEPEKPNEPSTVDITFVQDGRDVVLATVTASKQFRIRETVTIPRWATTGRARLLVDGARPTQLTVTATINTAPTPPRATDELARTGANAPVGPLAATGLALLAVGGLLVRRPRTTR